jgi:hypothetical protein
MGVLVVGERILLALETATLIQKELKDSQGFRSYKEVSLWLWGNLLCI